MARGRVRPSKPASVLGLIVGIGFVIFGLSGFGGSDFGAFGALWLVVALGITVMSAINVFTKSGVAEQVVEFDAPPPPSAAPESVEQRLARLEQLRRTGAVSTEEYQQQRARIIGDL